MHITHFDIENWAWQAALGKSREAVFLASEFRLPGMAWG